MRRDEELVFLASTLSQRAQAQLDELGQLLGARRVDTFSAAGGVFVFKS